MICEQNTEQTSEVKCTTFCTLKYTFDMKISVTQTNAEYSSFRSPNTI